MKIMSKKDKAVKNIYLALSIILLCAIFFFSMQPANTSSTLSVPVTLIVAKILSFFNLSVPTMASDFSALHNIVRNCAHLFLLMCLGFCTGGFIKFYDFKYKFLYSFLFCALYGLLDEIKQIFIPGRGFSGVDVGMDCIGALIGTCIAALIYKLSKRKKYN